MLDCYDELGNRYQLPVYVLSTPTNLIEDNSEGEAGADPDANASPGTEVPLKLRLSHLSKDLKVMVRSTDTVHRVKRLLHEKEGVEPERQRWFFGGKLLNDKLRIEDAHIPKGFVVQVIVSPASWVGAGGVLVRVSDILLFTPVGEIETAPVTVLWKPRSSCVISI